MLPKIKSRLKEIAVLRNTTYFFVVLTFAVVITIAYVALKPVGPVEYDESFVIPKISILTTEEVEVERKKLPAENIYVYEQAVGTQNKAVIEETSSEPAVVVSNEEVAEIIIQQKQPLTAIKPEAGDYTEASTNGPIQLTEIIAPNQKSSGITIIEEVYAGNLPSKETTLVFEGSIFSLDNESNTITIALKSGGFATAYIIGGTNIIINNKNMRFSDLRVADNVRAQGIGKLNSNVINASNITVTGSIKLIPI